MIKKNSVLTRIFGLVTGIVLFVAAAILTVYDIVLVVLNFGKEGGLGAETFISIISVLAAILACVGGFKVVMASWNRKPEVVLYKSLVENMNQTLLLEMTLCFSAMVNLIGFAITPEESVIPTPVDYVKIGILVLIIVDSFFLGAAHVKDVNEPKIKTLKFIFGIVGSIGGIVINFIHFVLCFFSLNIVHIFIELLLLAYFVMTLLTQITMGLTNGVSSVVINKVEDNQEVVEGEVKEEVKEEPVEEKEEK